MCRRQLRRKAELESEALARLAGAKDLLGHVVAGDVGFQPWTRAARELIEAAERILEPGCASDRAA
jgi:hypothetical protein